MSYFRYNGRHIYYEEAGEGAPLLLLHGNTASSRMYEDIARRYEANFRVILIDFLGHGRHHIGGPKGQTERHDPFASKQTRHEMPELSLAVGTRL